MDQHDLKQASGAKRDRKRVGRGNASGHGTTATRGHKGQRKRGTVRPGFEGGQIPLVRALSRVRGFNNKFRVEFEPVNLDRLETAVIDGEVTPDTLKATGVVKSNKPIKILGDGELTAKLKVTADRFSGTARAKIEGAGGSVIELMPPKPKKERAEPAAKAAAPEAPEAEASSAPSAQSEPAAEAPAAQAPRARRGRQAPAEPEEKAEETPE